jgi:hypothetical protein
MHLGLLVDVVMALSPLNREKAAAAQGMLTAFFNLSVLVGWVLLCEELDQASRECGEW